jgi:hypothetical protein
VCQLLEAADAALVTHEREAGEPHVFFRFWYDCALAEYYALDRQPARAHDLLEQLRGRALTGGFDRHFLRDAVEFSSSIARAGPSKCSQVP